MCVLKRRGRGRGFVAPVLFFSSSSFSSSSPPRPESEERVGFAVGLEQCAATEARADCAGPLEDVNVSWRRERHAAPSCAKEGKESERNQEGLSPVVKLATLHNPPPIM